MVTAGALSVPLQACTLEHKQPIHVASSCLSLLVLGRRDAKNNFYLWDLHCGGLCCLLSSGPVPLCPLPLLLLPVATLSQPPSGHAAFPFIAALRVSPGGWWLILGGLGALPGTIWEILLSLQSLLAQLSPEEACAACALDFLPALSPGSLSQMSFMFAEPNSVVELLVFLSYSCLASPALSQL